MEKRKGRRLVSLAIIAIVVFIAIGISLVTSEQEKKGDDIQKTVTIIGYCLKEDSENGVNNALDLSDDPLSSPQFLIVIEKKGEAIETGKGGIYSPAMDNGYTQISEIDKDGLFRFEVPIPEAEPGQTVRVTYGLRIYEYIHWYSTKRVSYVQPVHGNPWTIEVSSDQEANEIMSSSIILAHEGESLSLAKG